MPPGRVTARTHSTSMMTNSALIMTFVMRSTPFCRPRLQISTPSTTTMAMYTSISPGLASSALKIWLLCSAVTPVSCPVALFTMKASIQPATVV